MLPPLKETLPTLKALAMRAMVRQPFSEGSVNHATSGTFYLGIKQC